jgi:hypothetical protein
MSSTTYVETRVISLNSAFAATKRNGTFLSDVVFEIGSVLQDHHDIVHRSITLSTAEIPVSYYGVNYTNEKFILNSTTIDIPVGNYNSSTLAATMVSLIQSTLGISMSIIISKVTGKFTFSAPVPFTFSSASSDLILGFNGSNLVGVLVGGSYTATSPFLCNLLGITQLNISSTLINSQNYVSGGQSNLLGTITVNSGPYGIILYSSIDKIGISNREIDSIDIQIRDQFNQLINFNNAPWSMTILVNIERKIDLGIQRTQLSDLFPGKEADLSKPDQPKTQDEQDLAILTNE